MKMRKKISFVCFTTSLAIIAIPMSLFASTGMAPSQGGTPDSNIQGTIDVTDPLATFTYVIEGRPDPFQPFIKEKTVDTVNMDEVVENDEMLTGMQLFEPGQLKLVAIAFESNGELAMVEDAAGKGYAIRPGVKIGKKGVVSRIEQNQVIIEETSVTRAGKKLITNIVMQLKKQGEE